MAVVVEKGVGMEKLVIERSEERICLSKNPTPKLDRGWKAVKG